MPESHRSESEIEPRCEHGTAWDEDCDRCCDFCGEAITGVPGSHSCYAGTWETERTPRDGA